MVEGVRVESVRVKGVRVEGVRAEGVRVDGVRVSRECHLEFPHAEGPRSARCPDQPQVD